MYALPRMSTTPSNDSPVTLQYLPVHYFQTCRVRHWINQEIYLSPEFLTLKVYATIANIGIDFVPSSFPQVEAFSHIPLPAAFIGGKPAGTEAILNYLRRILDLDQNVSQSSKEERAALSILAQSVIAEAIEYMLYGHFECYTKFTQPVLFDSMPRPFADWYAADQHAIWVNRDMALIDSRLKDLFKFLNNKIRSSKFFFCSDAPSICDIVLYSHLSVLLSIPEKFCPFFFVREITDETEEIMHRLKSFLLDFDDWLWQLNARRSEQLETNAPLASATLAARGPSLPASGVLTPSEHESEQLGRPLLGSGEDRKQNYLFLLAAAATMCSVVLFSKSQ